MTRAGARLLALVLTLGLGAPSGRAEPAPQREALARRARAVLGTPPPEASSPTHPVTPAEVDLGRRLYYDARLSKSQAISCNTCHPLDAYGVDHQPTSTGHRGQRGSRNAPTVYYAAFHVAQFWDGRASDVEEQAKGPLLNPVEMAMPSAAAVVALLRSIPGYEPLFRAAFPDAAHPISFDRVAQAIGAFERRLVTPAPFDDFLAGKLDALSEAQVRGLREFLDLGCTACHNGATVGGTTFQKLGIVHPYETSDPGRFAVTHREADRQVFKVPSLRNVAETAPYFHDGSVPTLEQAVRRMAYHQLGKELGTGTVQDLVTFLGSLTGRIDAEAIARPELPRSSSSTPPPDPS